MAARIMILAAICLLVVLPSTVRTLGFYSGEIWRFQQSLGGDKVLHLIVGASLMTAFLIISKAFSSMQKLTLMFLFASSILIVEELFQFLTPGRHFEWIDMFWGLLGALSVFLVCLIALISKRDKAKDI